MAMTQKLFWNDPYQTQLTTRVARVSGQQVWLEQTIFYAFSGGQESDSGTVGNYTVLDASKQGFDIVYTLADTHDLKVGQSVVVQIDWARRYKLMRLHFAAEMTLQWVYQYCPGIERVGAHIGEDKARIDFAREGSIAVLFEDLLREIAQLTNADRPIVTAFEDESKQRRYWKVEGFAQMACGGTHPRSTAEIGEIRLKRKNIGKGKERIEITLA